MKFRVNCGSHSQPDDAGEVRTWRTGMVVESDHDLCALHNMTGATEKFVRVSDDTAADEGEVQ